MEVINIAIAELKPYDRNPRVIPDSAVRAVANSLEKFGWQQPIVVDADNVVVVGHTRLKAAKKLGMKEVPIKYTGDLTEDEIAAYRLLDNRVGELTSWDNDILEQELDSINFDGLSTAFDSESLDSGLERFDFEDGLDDFDEDEESADAYSNPVIQYVLIFDNESQQEIWNGFLRAIKTKYTDLDTHAERIIEFIKENG